LLGHRLVLIFGNEVVAATLESGQLRALINEIVVNKRDNFKPIIVDDVQLIAVVLGSREDTPMHRFSEKLFYRAIAPQYDKSIIELKYGAERCGTRCDCSGSVEIEL
jgi:hypothetical protein